MSDYPIHNEEYYKSYTCIVKYDESSWENPIEDYDQPEGFGIDLSNHRDFKAFVEELPVDMGDFFDYLSGRLDPDNDEWDAEVAYTCKEFEDKYFYRIVRMYCHGSCTIGIGNGYPFNDPWDSGTAGVVFIPKETVIREGLYGASEGMTDDRLELAAVTFMKSQVELFDDWMNGRGFYWVVEDSEGEVLESCGGYWGDSGAEYAMQEALNTAEYLHQEQEEKRQKHLKTLIKEHVPLQYRADLLGGYL